MRTLRAFARLATTVLALVALACAPRAASDEVSSRPWVIATSVDLAGVNELVSGGVRFTHEIQDLLFLELGEEQPDYAQHPPTVEPELAERWEASPDGRTLTFHLRPDARWSDGTPITSADVLFTVRAQRASEIAWRFADSKDAIESVDAPDPHTVRFHLQRTYPYALIDINDGQILPEHAWSALPFAEWRSGEDWFRSHLVTSGPYQIASWRPGSELVLEANPRSLRYQASGPRRVVFRVVPDPAARIEQLIAGDFDFVDGLTALEASRVARRPDLRVISCAAHQFDFIGWNERRPPFDSPEVRRALTLGIDRQALIDSLWKGWAKIAAGPVPSDAWARDPELRPWPYDPARARELLARNRFTDSDGDGILDRDGKPFRFVLTTNAGNQVRADALVLIQEQLARIGVAVEPRILELQTLIERNRAGDYDATIAGWAIDTTFDFRPYFHSAEQEGYNFVAYANPEVDRLLEATRSAPDIEAAKPDFVELQRILHREQPYTFLWEPQKLAATRASIDGVEISALSALRSLPYWRRRGSGR